jgi:glutamyl-tRNA reductase
VEALIRLGLLDFDAAERIRRREVVRVLRKVDLSPEKQEAVERLSHALVAKLLGSTAETQRAEGAGVSLG